MKTLLTILITALVTSLFWLLGIYGFALISHTPREVVIEDIKMNYDSVEKPTQSVVADAPAPKDYSKEIVGYWIPVEGNSYHLEITKYGTVTQWKHYSSGKEKYEQSRDEYNIKGDRLKIFIHDCRVEVTTKNGFTYLEIYGSEKYAGKYRKSTKR